MNMVVNVVSPTGKIIALLPQRDATVAEVKDMIFSHEGTPSCLQLLFFEGCVVPDDCTMEHISNIADGTLYLLLCQSLMDMTPELLWRISSNDPILTSLEILGQHLGAAGCQALADALVLNTCITSLNLYCSFVGPAGASVLLPALLHLTGMTCLNLSGSSLQSPGVVQLCGALQYMTALTELDLSFNMLSADDGARVCGAMTRLKTLDLSGNDAAASGNVGWLAVLTSLQELRFQGTLFTFRILLIVVHIACHLICNDGGRCCLFLFSFVYIQRSHSFCSRYRLRRVWFVQRHPLASRPAQSLNRAFRSHSEKKTSPHSLRRAADSRRYSRSGSTRSSTTRMERCVVPCAAGDSAALLPLHHAALLSSALRHASMPPLPSSLECPTLVRVVSAAAA